MSNDIRRLSGMQYESIELEHDASRPMSEVLYDLADWIQDNEIHGILTSIHTGIHPNYEDRFLTNLIWSL